MPMTISSVAAGLTTFVESFAPKPATGLRWYLLQCAGRSDNGVREWLDRLAFENYYPMVREMRPVPRRKLTASQRRADMRIMRPQIVPFFPRYMFVRFDIGRDGWRSIFEF